MVYIKLENNMDKFLEKYQNFPKSMRKIIFKSKCRNGKFISQKIDGMDYIILPEVNKNVLKRLSLLANIRCWKNICISNNLMNDKNFCEFLKENSLNLIDGKWLYKNIVDKIAEYILDINNEKMENQEISILCNKLDENILFKIKEMAQKSKICNILTNNIKQFKKLENELFKSNGIVLNISTNFKKTLLKSSIIINFDFTDNYIERCIFSKNAYIINIDKNIKIDKKYWNGKAINSYETNMPNKYLKYKEIFDGFDNFILYESFIYKHTNYMNIKKEIEEDNVKIVNLIDSNNNIMKKTNANLVKRLDKISI